MIENQTLKNMQVNLSQEGKESEDGWLLQAQWAFLRKLKLPFKNPKI